MRQIVQSVSDGLLKIVEVPQPEPSPTEVLVATRRSLLSAGTERAVRQLASANLFQKAKARPDLLRQVITRARVDGIRSTVTAVRTRLDDEMPLGYSGAGRAVSVGEDVNGIRPGMRVATASAGHAEYQIVPGLLTVPIPDEVSDQAAAFGAVAAIALQGLRQAEVGVGGTICVIGLGLVGQLTVRLGLAGGLNVVGVDVREWTAQLATDAGAIGLVESGQATTERVREVTRGRGVDSVLLTAATASSGPVTRATELTRDRGRLVVVGDIGLQLDRRPFYEHELDIRFARSYGPGRYERSYEEWGVDFPIGHVRWTEGRNIEAYLDLVAKGRMKVDDLVTHVFKIEDAAHAYEVMQSDSSSLAIQLSYKAPAEVSRRPITTRHKHMASEHPRAGIIGAGNYARATFLPAMKEANWLQNVIAVTSAKGLSARHLSERYGIELVLPTAKSLIEHDDVDVVFILSRHDSHAELAVKALEAGKHVFVEKPLALTEDELDAVTTAYERNHGHLFVGFNRRYAETTRRTQRALLSGNGSLSINYRVNAGRLPESHWYKDRRYGGRILGEVCHFIDLANWIVKETPSTVRAIGSGTGEPVLEEDVAVLLGYPGGSMATITYATGAYAGTPKERVEILGHGQTFVIDDFRRLNINQKQTKGLKADKGHVAGLRRFSEIIATSCEGTHDLEASIHSTAATLDVINQLIQ